MSGNVIEELAKNYEKVQKGVGEVMGGPMIETEAKRILMRGRDEGRVEGKQFIKHAARDCTKPKQFVLIHDAIEKYRNRSKCKNVIGSRCFNAFERYEKGGGKHRGCKRGRERVRQRGRYEEKHGIPRRRLFLT